MKSSFYNSSFSFEEKTIVYNSISDKYLVLEPILHELFQAATVEESLPELKVVHENLYEILEQNGFIVDTEKDELQFIKDISFKTDFNDETFLLTINSTMNCNFKCWYCYETHIKDSRLEPEVSDKIVLFIENLFRTQPSIKNLNIEWFGGEPLLYYKKSIRPLAKQIKLLAEDFGINLTSGFTTNAYLLTEEILEECKTINVKHFQITLDGHRERHNKVRFVSNSKGSYDEIVERIKLCLKHKFRVTIRINISEETVADLLKIIDDFRDLTITDKSFATFSFHEVWQEERDLSFDISNFIDVFRQNKFRCISKSDNLAGIYNSCYADKINQAVINYDGNVFKCTARDFKETSKEGDLSSTGEIQWNATRQRRVFDSRFSNKPCLECKILPLCNGGCSQHRIENEGSDYCMFDFDEAAKLNVIKERFFSRIQSKKLSDHGHDVINGLMKMDFAKRRFNATNIFQETIDGIFSSKVSEANINVLNIINNKYIELLKQLRNGKVSFYKSVTAEIEEILRDIELNDQEEHVLNILSEPVIAYFHYKNGNFDDAISATHNSIITDDLFYGEYPFLYAHKIQQLHNLMRIQFRQNKFDSALALCNSVLKHLLSGEKIAYSIGKWEETYDIKTDPTMEPMVFQIFCETIGVINSVSTNVSDETYFFDIAFQGIDFDGATSDSSAIIIYDFLKLKKEFFLNELVPLEKIAAFQDAIESSDYFSMCIPLMQSLFSSIGRFSYTENKEEFRRAYALS